MKASQLIVQLAQVINIKGDMEVTFIDANKVVYDKSYVECPLGDEIKVFIGKRVNGT